MRIKSALISLLSISLILMSACSSTVLAESDPVSELSSEGDSSDLTYASAESHLDGDPNYDVVFPQDEVNEITIQISPENWQAMMDDMSELYGESGTSDNFRAGGDPGLPVQGERQPFQRDGADSPAMPGDSGDMPAMPGDGGDRPAMPGDRAGRPAMGEFPGGNMLGGSDDSNPIWVEAEISFEGEIWEHVGIRFKGNSSLRSSWSSGSLKLPFKLDFDQFEDDYPLTDDQRFYGFKQLTFASNFHDDSLLREKIAADLFREAGVASAHTAFYAVSIDYGDGPLYLGLYTAVEVVDDTVIETQFSDDSGNVYKPEGSGASFAAGSFTEASFDKETNQDQEDYSDILALYDALHSNSRLTDPESWRQGLEEVFDVDTFLNWLAVNTSIQNWDTYGAMTHNYYLYNDPETGQLVWIPWDNNESLKVGEGMRSAITLDLSTVNHSWPLISYLRDDLVYYQTYLTYLESFLEDVFVEEEMAELYQYYHDLISPYVLDESPEFTLVQSRAAFERSVNDLIQHTQQRISAGESLLADQ